MPASTRGYVQYPGQGHYRPSSRRLGGKFPEGWEFFKPAQGILWFLDPMCSAGRSQNETLKQDSTNMVTYRIIGLCPIKCPLDRCFDASRLERAASHANKLKSDAENRAKQQSQSKDVISPVTDSNTKHTTTELTDSAGSEIDAKEELRIQERDRTSKARYFSSWAPSEISKLLEKSWIQKDTSDSDDGRIHTPRHRPVVDIVAVINLCATDRYYDKEAFLRKGQAFSYIRTEGGGKIPSSDDMLKLEQVWNELFDRFAVTEQSDDLEQLLMNRWGYQWPIVLIHCTHGVNRTGFCANYLMLKHSKDLSVKESLELFHAARGHAINKGEHMWWLVCAVCDRWRRHRYELIYYLGSQMNFAQLYMSNLKAQGELGLYHKEGQDA